MKYLRLYPKFMAQQLKSQLEYPTSFILGVLSGMVDQIIVVGAFLVMMQNTTALEGWNLYQIQLLSSFVVMGLALNRMFTDHLWNLGWGNIATGDFAKYLMRPINPLYHFLASHFNKDGLGDMLMATALFVSGASHVHIEWSVGMVLYVALMMLVSGVIFFAVNLITASLSFWMMDSSPITLAVWSTNEFAKFPLGIYPRGVRIMMSFIIPYGIASYAPAQHMLGKDSSLMWAPIGMAAVMFCIGYALWSAGIKRFSGAGS